MKVPFLDLKAQYDSIRDEVINGLEQVCNDCAFAGGKFVEKFENEFASYCQAKYAVAVGSGTEALWAALKGLGIGDGDEVITTANTFIATAEAISYCGAKPVFVDIEQQTYNMNPELLQRAVTSRTKAIIPVHLYGQCADLDLIIEVAKANNLFVIEDACQAHGAKYKSKEAGSIGEAGCFSFYPGKNLGAYGEGGAVVTNNSELAENIRMLRDHGQKGKYNHSIIGWNARMDGFQGAVLSVKLSYLDRWNEARRKNASLYSKLLADCGEVKVQPEASYAEHVYHLYVVRTRNRDALQKHLAENDVFCGIHYPVPLHLQKAYDFLGYEKGAFPITEMCADDILSLPMYPELRESQIEKVVSEIKAFRNS